MKRWVPILVRVFLGFIFTAAALAGMMGKVPPPEPEPAQAFMGQLMASGLLYVVKILELMCGLALLSGFFVRLALIILAPIVFNIAYFHAALDPAGLPVGITLMVLWVANAVHVRNAFLPLLQMRDRG